MKRWASMPVQSSTGKKRKVKSTRSLRALAAAEQSWRREVWLGGGQLGVGAKFRQDRWSSQNETMQAIDGN